MPGVKYCMEICSISDVELSGHDLVNIIVMEKQATTAPESLPQKP